MEAKSTEEGRIYMVPEHTERDMSSILADSIKSVSAQAGIAVHISLEGQDNGVYWLYATDLAGNISEPGAFTILGVGFEALFNENLGIYPNPTTGLLNIEAMSISRPSVEIRSLDGRLIFQTRMDGQSGEIDISFLQKGIYFLTINSGGLSYSEKIIKL